MQCSVLSGICHGTSIVAMAPDVVSNAAIMTSLHMK
jgi:hypothetical protein